MGMTKISSTLSHNILASVFVAWKLIGLLVYHLFQLASGLFFAATTFIFHKKPIRLTYTTECVATAMSNIGKRTFVVLNHIDDLSAGLHQKLNSDSLHESDRLFFHQMIKTLGALRDQLSRLDEELQHEPHHLPPFAGFDTFIFLLHKTTNRIENELPLKRSRHNHIIGNRKRIALSSFLPNFLYKERLVTRKLRHLHSNLEALLLVFPKMMSLVKHYRTSSWKENQQIENNPIDGEEIVNTMTLDPFWYWFNPGLGSFRKTLMITYASLGLSHQMPAKTIIQFRKKLSTAATALRCTLAPRKAAEIIQAIQSQIDILLLQKIWNLPDDPFISLFQSYLLPSIAVSQEIVIPSPLDSPLKGAGINARIISAKPLPFSVSHLLPSSSSYVTTLKRALSSKTSLISLEEGSDDIKLPRLPLIMHMHGGGFVSGSSAMHENYLRRWAIETNAIIISIDYKLAPEYKYPYPLLECFYAYKWLVTTSKLGMTPSKIAVVGDSAGGNLATSLTFKCIEENIRKPDGLILHYPALDMTSTIYPSRLLFKNDPVVSLFAAKLCLAAYIPEGCDPKEYYLSPLYAPSSLLAQLPPVKISVCEYDPLSDEAILFADRLAAVNPGTQLKVFRDLPHGFLSVAKFVPELAEATVIETASWFNDVLDL